jgi:hypothetical protein
MSHRFHRFMAPHPRGLRSLNRSRSLDLARGPFGQGTSGDIVRCPAKFIVVCHPNISSRRVSDCL